MTILVKDSHKLEKKFLCRFVMELDGWLVSVSITAKLQKSFMYLATTIYTHKVRHEKLNHTVPFLKKEIYCTNTLPFTSTVLLASFIIDSRPPNTLVVESV